MKRLLTLLHRWVLWWGSYVILKTLYHGQDLSTEQKRKDVTRILVISLDYIGDNVLSAPLFPVLAKAFPQASIDVMTGTWSADLYRAHPCVRGIIDYNCRWLDRSAEPWPLARKKAVLKRVRETRYDLIVDLRGSWGTMTLAMGKASRWRADLRAAFIRDRLQKARRKILSGPLRDPVDWRKPYQVLQILRQIGITVRDIPRVEVFLSSADQRAAEDLLRQEGIDRAQPLIMMYPCAADPQKLWPAERWSRVGNALAEQYRARIIISGAPADREQAEAIIRTMRNPAVNLAGRAKLMTAAAVTGMSFLCVCLDSGPMHIAGALGTPVVALFGADDPHTCAPWTLACRLIYHGEVPADRMAAITVEEVLAAADDLIRSVQSHTV